ncbi:MAG: YbaN family protein [Erysipelotrichaceae bacterium]|nr:YbaN family protein [Erysipelotrichaceae bacterium]
MKIKKIIFVCIGVIGLIIGAIGAIVPLMPAFPFLLVAAICFSKSSEKLDRWFKESKLYKENLADLITGCGMTKKAKIRVMITITLLMLIGFIVLHAITIGRIILSIIWLFHLLYFIFGVKTKTITSN